MTGKYGIGAVVLGKWRIERKIGEGSFGTVYEIRREEFGQTYTAALKVITVPRSGVEYQAALDDGMSGPEAEQYFYSVVEDIVREFAIMSKLKGMTNVVSCEDQTVIRRKDGVGWDVLIRMELLTPLLTYAYQHPFSRRDIIRVGIDMCRALELCQKYNVIHRDIKPENIFVSNNGDFKLGDFGIARTVEKAVSGLSKKGTYHYMAPEVYRGSEYGFSVDTYSLGIVLYRLLNNNRAPFLPQPPEPITYQKREEALSRRMGGEALPPPCYGEGRLGEIVLKACAFNPKDRYESPALMRQALEGVLYDAQDAALIYPSGDELSLYENQYISCRTQEPGESAAGAEAFALVAAEVTEKTESVFGGLSPAGDEAEKTPGEFLPPAGGEPEEFWPAEATEKTESVFGRSMGKPEAAGTAPDPGDKEAEKATVRKPKKKKILIGGIAAAVLLAGGIALWRGQIATLPADIPVGPAAESEPSDTPEPTEPVLSPVAAEGEVQCLRSMNVASDRQPIDTVRVAILACEEWQSLSPNVRNLAGDGITADVIRVDNWLREDGVIQASFNQEVYYADEGNEAKMLKSILNHVEQLLDGNEYDLVVCCAPWSDILAWDDSGALDRLVKLANAHPEKEILLSGGLSFWYLYEGGNQPLPAVDGELAFNLTAALTNNLTPYEPSDLPEYMLGVAAALQCRSGKIGIAMTAEWDSFGAGAFAAGVASVDNGIELLLYGDKLSDSGEAKAVKQLCEAGADVIWCSDYNEKAHAAAEEYGALACCLTYTLPDQPPSVGLALSALGQFDDDVRLTAQCMKDGLTVWSQILTPAYVYLRGGVTEEVHSQLWDVAFNRFRDEGDNLFVSNLADALTVSVLHMPERPAELEFFGDILTDRWFVPDSFFNTASDVMHSGTYYNVTRDEIRAAVMHIRSMATSLDYSDAESISCVLEWDDASYEVTLSGSSGTYIGIDWVKVG